MDQLGYCRSLKIVLPLRLRCLLTTEYYIFCWHVRNTILQRTSGNKDVASHPLIPNHHVPTTSKVRC